MGYPSSHPAAKCVFLRAYSAIIFPLPSLQQTYIVQNCYHQSSDTFH